MLSTKIMLVAAAALVNDSGRVLVQQRPMGKPLAGLWEFPGGKVEAGETPEAALVRELEEELGIGVDTAALEPVAFASESQGERQLLLLLFAARAWRGTAEAHHAAALDWLRPESMRTLPMPPADVPLVEALVRLGL